MNRERVRAVAVEMAAEVEQVFRTRDLDTVRQQLPLLMEARIQRIQEEMSNELTVKVQPTIKKALRDVYDCLEKTLPILRGRVTGLKLGDKTATFMEVDVEGEIARWSAALRNLEEKMWLLKSLL